MGQTTLFSENFDSGTTNYATSNGTLYTGSSGTGDRPQSSAFAVTTTNAYGVSNTTGTVTFVNSTGLAAYTTKYFEFRLAAWSLSSSTNGVDGTDIVTVSVSLDGGSTYSSELTVSGGTNSYWHYTSGTGTATTTYDGNNTPIAFAPSGGANRTTDGYSTIRINLPDGCAQARLRVSMVNNSASERWTMDNMRLVGTLAAPCVVAGSPSAAATAIAASPGCNSCLVGFSPGNGSQRIVVVSETDFTDLPANATAYTANNSFGLGSQIGTNNFTVYNGTGNSVNVSGLIPNVTYYAKIFEYNGTGTNCDESYLTASIGSVSFTTTADCSTPEIRSILVDACGNGSDEGLNEYVLIQNGSGELYLNDLTVEFPSAGTYCNGGACGTRTLGNNADFIDELNTLAGCTLFQYANPIPANGKIILFTGETPNFTYNFSSQCPATDVFYAIFCNNTSGTGRFVNSGSSSPTLTIDFGSSNDVVSYSPNSIGGNGGFVDFNDAGDPTYRLEPTCIYPLGVTFSSFNASVTSQGVELNWRTLSEEHADFFSVERSGNQVHFKTIDEMACIGSKNRETAYRYLDLYPERGINYYRLKQVDYDGKTTYSEIAVANLQPATVISYLPAASVLVFSEDYPKGTGIAVYTVNGQLVAEELLEERTQFLHVQLEPGIYLVQIREVLGRITTGKIAAY